MWLEEDAGITLGVTSLTSYISRIRRREKANRSPETPAAQSVRAETESIRVLSAAHPPAMARADGSSTPRLPNDPLAQAMRVLSRPGLDIRKVHNDGDPEGRNLV